jgi:hypothetical protein
MTLDSFLPLITAIFCLGCSCVWGNRLTQALVSIDQASTLLVFDGDERIRLNCCSLLNS